MNTKKLAEITLAIHNASAEAAQEAIDFVKPLPEFCKGHEAAIESLAIHYAQIGAREALNYMLRNSLVG